MNDAEERPAGTAPLPSPGAEGPAAERPLGGAAKRALAEAEARRRSIDAQAAAAAPVPEKDGRDGPEPVRYGDWEVKGIASDF